MEAVMAITRDESNRRVLKTIGKIKNRDPESITSDQELEGDLGFDRVGKQALAGPLNSEFHAEHLSLRPDDTGNCESVGDVEDTTWGKLPDIEKK